jgi:hypothetical protein
VLQAARKLVEVIPAGVDEGFLKQATWAGVAAAAVAVQAAGESHQQNWESILKCYLYSSY